MGNTKTHPAPPPPESSVPPSDGQELSGGGPDGNNPADDDGEYYGEKINFGPNWSGPVKKRHCTDVICLLGFVTFLGAWSFVAVVAAQWGDINKVIYPTDSQGRICGGHPDLLTKPYLIFFDLTRCLNPGVLAHGCPTPQVCVEKCPTISFSGLYEAEQGRGEEVAKAGMKSFCAPMSDKDWQSKSVATLIEEGLCPAWVLPSQAILGRCIPLPEIKSVVDGGGGPGDEVVSSDQTVDKTPITASTLAGAVNALTAFLSVSDFVQRVGRDLADTWWMIGIALVAATVVSFIWILLMRFFTALMVWASVLLVFLLCSGVLGYSVYRYLWIINNVDVSIYEQNIFDINWTPQYLQDLLRLTDTWLAFIVLLSILLLVILMVLIALRKRIQIAIKLIEQGSKAVAQMRATLFFPILPFFLHLVVVFGFVTMAALLGSVGDGTYQIYYPSGVVNSTDRDTLIQAFQEFHSDEGKNYTAPLCEPDSCVNPATDQMYLFSDECVMDEVERSDCKRSCQEEVSCQFVSYSQWGPAQWMQWFNLFGFFWAMAFVSALSEMILAGVFAAWYWTFKKEDVPFWTLATSIKNASIFHLGTIAFGSLIIAIIRFIRAILDFVEKKLKMYNNDLTRCLLCMCKCCLWCLERFMRFINRNAYIMTAIKSTNFCMSASQAFNLLMRNILRVVVLNKVVDFLLFLGKVVIMAGVGTMSYFVFSGAFPELNDRVPTLNYFVTPVVTIVIGTYFITSSFFGVYEMAVDTLFLCFLEDLERNDGTPSRPYFMSKGLQKIVGKMNAFNAEQMRMKQS